MGLYLGELKIEQDCVILTIRLIEIPSADMLRIKKWWEIEENLVVEALRGYASERYEKLIQYVEKKPC